MKNSLFTACKTGDVETLRNLLAVFSMSVPSLESPEKKAQPIAINNENLEQEPSIEMVVTDEHAEKYKDMQDNGSTHTNSGDNSSDKSVTPTYVSFSGTENLQDNLILKDSIQKPFGKTSSRPASIVSKSEELLSPVDTNDMLNEPIGDNKYSLLHIAAREGHRKVIRLLLEFGANPAMRYLCSPGTYTYQCRASTMISMPGNRNFWGFSG